MSAPEPTFLVIERAAEGGEVACIYRDRVFAGARPIYTLRIDRLPPDAQEFWMSKSCAELLATYHWLRDEGTLPPSNIADPPKEKRREGRLMGDWWTQPKKPWPDQPAAPWPAP
jgi:hypothetical protein